MSEPQLRPDLDRRHPRLPYEELRRQLLDADRERFRLVSQLRAAREAPSRGWAAWPAVRRRAVLAAGILIIASLAGGIAWQMCASTARADERASVRVQETIVAPHVVAGELPAAPAVAVKVAVKSSAPVHRPKPRALTVVRVRRERSVPRPLSPGEFGRPKIAY